MTDLNPKLVIYKGSCHCGAIAFRFGSLEIKDGMRCNCSICSKKGSIISNFTIDSATLQIDDPDGLMTIYQFNEKIAKHYFCSQCGIFTFVETRLNPGEYRVNLGCIEDIDVFNIPVVMFDGTSI